MLTRRNFIKGIVALAVVPFVAVEEMFSGESLIAGMPVGQHYDYVFYDDITTHELQINAEYLDALVDDMRRLTDTPDVKWFTFKFNEDIE